MVTKKIKHKNEDGTVVEVDLGAEAKNVSEDATHRFTTDAEKTNWNDANSKKHSHSNKTVLDKITQALLDKWNSALTSLPMHTHTKSEITDMPTEMKNPEMLRIVFNGRPWDIYDGSKYTEVDITPNNIGAAPGSHTHPAGDIIQDVTHRIATDAEKADWNEIKSVKESLEKYASLTVVGEILNLPGGGDISVTGEILSIPLKI